MNNIYLFSQSSFLVNSNININKNNFLKLTINPKTSLSYKKNIDDCCSVQINFTDLKSNNFYRVFHFNEDIFVELITSDFNSLHSVYTTKTCEVFIYNNSVRIIKNNMCYTYFYNIDSENFVLEQDENLYIFNRKNIIIFNLNKITFSLMHLKKFVKNDKNIEFLCKLTCNSAYFLHFSVDLTKSNIIVKKLKSGENKTNSKSIPYSLFYLAKYNFNECKFFLSDASLLEKVVSYFNNYENILEIENQYYIYNSNIITPISFTINNNNKVEDID